MKKLHHVEYDYSPSTGTSNYKLLLIASFRDLCDLLGNPSYIGSGDEKVQVTWVLSDDNNPDVAITIYDWKKRTSIYNIYEWNIGSKGLEEGEVLKELENFGLRENVRKIVITGTDITKERIV